jgi:2,4-dienoyl-CoA reductase-like NADH-dependent reductase (Old Yellow Enzyme family)
MPELFESSVINSLELRNRFVRSATWEGLARPDGSCTPGVIDAMTALARGGVGMIITSHTFVSPEGKAGSRQLGIHNDLMVDGLKALTESVHNQGGKIAVQLAHAGIFAATEETGMPALAVSAVEPYVRGPVRVMGGDDMEKFVESFAEAAVRAKSAGFDAVQVHSAHGYLLSQFLSPAFNRRSDEYGGPLENRARALLKVISAIRGSLGRGFPVIVKMNCMDFLENGLTLEDSVRVGRMLAEAGVDAIELSGGTLVSGKLSPSRTKIDSPEQEAYFRDAAKIFKKEVGLPLILVGGIRSFSTARSLIEGGTADYISMSRPFICEPGLVARWESGDTRPSECVSDNRCFKPIFAGSGFFCLTKKEKE